MESLETKLSKMLEENGMFPNDAKAVVEAMKAAPENETMKERWGDSWQDYPSAILSLAWLSAKEYALKWIDTNHPKAWYRPMFTE